MTENLYISGSLCNSPDDVVEVKTYTSNVNEQIVQTFQTLEIFRQARLFTDVILCVSDEEFYCHKLVLAASSKYFRAMFSAPFKEQQKSRVVLEHICPGAMRCLLQFAYLGTLDLSSTNVQEVFSAASLLDYPLAVGQCVHFIEQHLDVTNCLAVEALADLHGLPSLSQVAHKFAVDNFASLMLESNEWTSLSVATVASYLSSEKLDIPSERVAWNACMSWISHDVGSRLSHLSKLLPHVRLNQLEPDFLARQLSENPLLQASESGRALVNSCLQLLQARDVGDSTAVPPREPVWLPARLATLKRPTLVVLGGLNDYLLLRCMEALSPSKSCWSLCPQMPVDGLAWFSATVVSNLLYVIGGIRAGSIQSSVYVYSPVTGTWSQLASMPEPRVRFSCLAVGNSHIFVFSGLTVSCLGDQVQAFPHADRTSRLGTGDDRGDRPRVSSLTLMGLPSDHSVATVATSILRYDVCTDTWTVAGRSDQPRLESRMVLVDEETVPPVSRIPSGDQDDGCGGQAPPSEPSDGESFQQQTVTTTANTSNSSNSRRGLRQASCSITCERVIVEIGGITDGQPHGSDQVSFYRLRTDLTIATTGDYIKLPRHSRYLNCAVHKPSRLVYLFWEETSELSVLDLTRHTLRPLEPAPATADDDGAAYTATVHDHSASSSSASKARLHCGFTWVGGRLYLVGGFAELSGDDRRLPLSSRADVHCYSPDTNSWSLVRIVNTTVQRAIFGCVCLNM